MSVLPFAAAGLSAASSVMSGLGQRAAGRARHASLMRNSVRQNEIGAAEAARSDRESRRAIGRGVTLAGKSGFTIEGSALDVIAGMAQEATADAGRAVWEGSLRAARLRADAKEAKKRGDRAFVTGLVKAGGTLLTAAAAGGLGGGAISGGQGQDALMSGSFNDTFGA